MHDEHVLIKMESVCRLYPVKLRWILPEEKDIL